jgi:putative addiction module CopG family antidote
MRSTRQLSITLPNEIAELVRAKVATGVYATESEVIRDGLRSLLARDRRRGLAARKGGSRLRRPQGRSISCGTSGQGARGTIGPKQESRREETRDPLSLSASPAGTSSHPLPPARTLVPLCFSVLSVVKIESHPQQRPSFPVPWNWSHKPHTTEMQRLRPAIEAGLM